MILAGDIGGTKTHLAVYQGNQCLYEEKYLSLNFNSLSDLVKQFLSTRTDKDQLARALGLRGLCAMENATQKFSLGAQGVRAFQRIEHRPGFSYQRSGSKCLGLARLVGRRIFGFE